MTFAFTVGASLALVLALWLASIPLRDVSIIDMAFSSLIALLVWLAWWLNGAEGTVPGLLLLLVLVWASRMTVYLLRRNLGHGEDPRYSKLRTWVPAGWPFYWFSLRQVFLLQGVVIWVLTLPLQIAMVTGGQVGAGPLSALGTLLWLVGFFFEAVGDHQLSRFKADPENRGRVMEQGLWRYTRHPNYFGELCQWWGLFVIALEAPWAWLGIVGPVAYSWLVINVTGQATLDRKLAREKPGYADYMARTSGLVPWPPRAP
jgi:steroid 5-alpha reductase family enzyme